MRLTNFYYLLKGWEDNVSIYQYMDLDYLISLLESKQYFVNRKCHFEDKGESVLPPKSLFGLNSFGVQLNKDEITKMTQEISEKLNRYRESSSWLTSCWTKDNTESLLMWKNYTTKIGVRIKSRIKDVIASIDTDKYTIVCGHMAYDGYTSKPYEECLFSKEPYFKDEHEVRFYFIPNNESMNSIKGENISVLPDIMIDEITLSPYIKEIAAVKIAELLRREYDLNVINLSKIRLK